MIEDKTMTSDKRFIKIYKQRGTTHMEIWVDKETGVNYLVHLAGYAGGITPLLDADGKPIVTPITDINQDD